MNKDVQQLLRAVKKQGAEIRVRPSGGGKYEVHGPDGFAIVHSTPSAGMHTGMLRKQLRAIGFRV